MKHQERLLMKVRIKRIDCSLPLPEYQTQGSAAFDLYSRLEIKISAKTVSVVPLNVILQLPQDHWALMMARSSLHKKGLMLINGVGVGDYDYRGESDEYHAALFNFSDNEAIVKKGERLVQMIVLPREKAAFQEIKEQISENSRGGFGSTG